MKKVYTIFAMFILFFAFTLLASPAKSEASWGISIGVGFGNGGYYNNGGYGYGYPSYYGYGYPSYGYSSYYPSSYTYYPSPYSYYPGGYGYYGGYGYGGCGWTCY